MLERRQIEIPPSPLTSFCNLDKLAYVSLGFLICKTVSVKHLARAKCHWVIAHVISNTVIINVIGGGLFQCHFQGLKSFVICGIL